MSKNSSSSPWPSDAILARLVTLCAALAGAILVLIVVFVLHESMPALGSVGIRQFVTDPVWFPKENLYNLRPMLWGSILSAVGAIAVAAPLGILAAVFNRFYAPYAVAGLLTMVLKILSGIPSVVFGVWGLVVLVPRISAWHAPGASLFAAILILAIMIVPTVALLAEATFVSLPAGYLQGAVALGLGRWATVRHVILPAARSGLFTGVLLATGRALGETMAVVMVAGNIVQVPASIFDPVRTLTANIALEMAYAQGLHRSALFVSGLLLLLLVICLVLTAEAVYRGSPHE